MVDAQFERAVFVAMLCEWIEYHEAHVPRLKQLFIKPIVIDVQTIGVCAIFGHVAEKLAYLALSMWEYSAVVTF